MPRSVAEPHIGFADLQPATARIAQSRALWSEIDLDTWIFPSSLNVWSVHPQEKKHQAKLHSWKIYDVRCCCFVVVVDDDDDDDDVFFL